MKKYEITLNDKVYMVEMEEVIESTNDQANTVTKSSGTVQEVKK